MKLTHLQINENLEEIISHITPDFPYVCVHVEMDTYPGGFISWHWHEEVEFIYVAFGNVEYHINNKVVSLHTGEACFINSNVLHMLRPVRHCHDSVLFSQTFKPIFLSGSSHNRFYQKYIAPVIENKTTEYYKISNDTPAHKELLDSLVLSYELAEKADFGYEFKVRSLLSDIWLGITKDLSPDFINNDILANAENELLKAMLVYIQNNYQNRLSVADIAKSVNISERSCYRLFKKIIGTSPVDYLLQYRVEVSEDLLVNSSISITEISNRVGFNSSSYFSKVFQQLIHCSPKEYRKRNRLEG